jgi:hypothetical protein
MNQTQIRFADATSSHLIELNVGTTVEILVAINYSGVTIEDFGLNAEDRARTFRQFSPVNARQIIYRAGLNYLQRQMGPARVNFSSRRSRRGNVPR